MSAECGKCGADIVYPDGTWPLGECPECSRDAKILVLERALQAAERMADASDEQVLSIVDHSVREQDDFWSLRGAFRAELALARKGLA